jgi:UDP-glucose 4-epimerase
MEKVLVTGVVGFIGSEVARRCISDGYEVVGVDDLSSGREARLPAGVEFIRADLSKKTSMGLLPRDCHTILHLAGQSSGELSFLDPVGDLERNVVSTLNLIEFGIKSGIAKILYASSMGVYGATTALPASEDDPCAPISPYGVGKLAAEHYLWAHRDSIEVVALRMFNVYGPGQDLQNLRQGMVSIYVAQAVSRGVIEVRGSLDRFRDFVFIDDVVEVWLRAIRSEAVHGCAVNVGTGVRTSVRDLLGELKALVPGVEIDVRTGTPGDQSGIFADTRKLQESLGPIHFTSLTEGLNRFVKWASSKEPQLGGHSFG